jgi:hypothetical protein
MALYIYTSSACAVLRDRSHQTGICMSTAVIRRVDERGHLLAKLLHWALQGPAHDTAHESVGRPQPCLVSAAEMQHHSEADKWLCSVEASP